MRNKDLLRALQLHQQGKLDEALQVLEDYLQANPDNAEVVHLAGIINAQQKHPDEALKYINNAIELQPDNAAFYNSKGNVYVQTQDYANAIEQYQRAIQLNPKYPLAQNNIGNCLYRQGKYDLAKQAYQTALSLDQNYVDAHYNLALLLTKLGDHASAEKHLIRTIELNEQYFKAYTLLADIYLQQEQYDKAIANYQNRIELSPHHADTWHGLGLALMRNGRFVDAVAALEKTLSIDAFHPECNYHLATALTHSGDQEKALNYYFRQNELQPMAECYFNIGVILMNKNRLKEAIQYLQQAQKMDADYLPIYLNLGAIYLKQHDTEKALQNYQHALTLKPDDSEIQHIIAALSQDETPSAAPEEYLKHLFDQYSGYYDQHLSKSLQYSVPQELSRTIHEEVDAEENSWRILDLGCGTGLCGEQFKPWASELIGVDVSANMVDVAKQKQIYDQLEVADIHQALTQYKDMDLILAGDVFTYIGDLEDIFNKSKAALKDGGLFAFSVEKTNIEPYLLQQSIRYAHSKKYLQNLIKQSGFKTLRFDNLILRKQNNNPVEGYLLVLQK